MVISLLIIILTETSVTDYESVVMMIKELLVMLMTGTLMMMIAAVMLPIGGHEQGVKCVDKLSENKVVTTIEVI